MFVSILANRMIVQTQENLYDYSVTVLRSKYLEHYTVTNNGKWSIL